MTEPLEFVEIECGVLVVRPDQRSYRQNSTEIMPNVKISVPIPATREHIANYGEWRQAGVEPKLTPKGLRALLNALENEYPPEQEEDLNAADGTDDKPAEKGSSDFNWDEW